MNGLRMSQQPMPGQGLSSGPMPRGASPSLNSKTGDMSIKNRSTISSSVKKQTGVQLRPGSAPKMRASTNENTNPAGPGSSMLKSQNSGSNQFGVFHGSMPSSNMALKVEGQHSSTSSKNMLNSFRNGPVK